MSCFLGPAKLPQPVAVPNNPPPTMPLLSCPRMQTINCLELWAKLLAAKADEPELRPLIYPVTQLLLGAARLVPAPAYFPLRLRCARALNRLGEATGTFIPVAPILLEVLQWSDLRRSPKPGPSQQPDVLLQLRVTKASMRSAQYQQEVVNQVGTAGTAGRWVVRAGGLFSGWCSVSESTRKVVIVLVLPSLPAQRHTPLCTRSLPPSAPPAGDGAAG